MNEVEEKNEENEETTLKKYPVLRYYRVFHISNVEGIEPLASEEININVNANTEEEIFTDAENAVNKYLASTKIKYEVTNGNRACYSPTTDTIQLPSFKQFVNMNEYYGTLFHEIVHSTGHESRLNRDIRNTFGNSNYAKEELVAELGSVYLNNHYGIETDETFDNATAYIQSWLSALKNDKKLFVSASTQAEKAANYVLSVA